MNKLNIGDKYWRVSDQQEYVVAYEDSVCYYLGHFRGCNSKVTSVSKEINYTFDDFVLTKKMALEELLKKQMEQVRLTEKFLGVEHSTTTIDMEKK